MAVDFLLVHELIARADQAAAAYRCPFVEDLRDETPRRVHGLVGGALLVMGDRWTDVDALMKPAWERGSRYRGDYVYSAHTGETVSGSFEAR